MQLATVLEYLEEISRLWNKTNTKLWKRGAQEDPQTMANRTTTWSKTTQGTFEQICTVPMVHQRLAAK
jgi:hypothetical protein